jgi:hypothetical protein
MWIWILASHSIYVTQICISEDTVILNWKSGIYKYTAITELTFFYGITFIK